jgi:hypothetical protein
MWFDDRLCEAHVERRIPKARYTGAPHELHELHLPCHLLSLAAPQTQAHTSCPAVTLCRMFCIIDCFSWVEMEGNSWVEMEGPPKVFPNTFSILELIDLKNQNKKLCKMVSKLCTALVVACTATAIASTSASIISDVRVDSTTQRTLTP